MQLPIPIIKPFNIFNKIFVRKDGNKMIDMEISKPLDKALNFNQKNFFEYMDVLLHNMNTEIIGSQSMKTTKKLYKYIRSLHLADTENIVFEVEDMVNTALSDNSKYAFKAGFMEACRLMKTLQSF